ncbi:hypothetical protein GEMRC1_013152 [Eukaryota sp. GEM-RC1]
MLLSSIRVPARVPFTSSVMLDEKKYFNYRTTDPVYDRMVSLNVTITPYSKEFESCVSGLSLFASSEYHHPDGFNAEHGGKGIQFVSIGEKSCSQKECTLLLKEPLFLVLCYRI